MTAMFLRTSALAVGLLTASCVPTAEDTETACIRGTGTGPEIFQPGAVTIAAVGDVLMHILLQQDAADQPDGYRAQFRHVAPYLRQADIAIANLEGPVARDVLPSGVVGPPGTPVFDGAVYSGYPNFNYHPSLVSALDDAGFDVLQTANNHALDRGPLGVDLTLQTIDAAGLAHTGTRPRNAPNAPWFTVVSSEGYDIAFLACTFSTNGRADPASQALLCYGDEAEVLANIRQLSTDPSIDAVVFTPHWGAEYTHSPDANQRRLARAALNAGASAVVGAHPHVLQPIEHYETNDGRPTFIAYSLGNFIASQWATGQRTGAILFFDLRQDGLGRLIAERPYYLPTRVTRYTSGLVVQPAEQAVDGQESSAHAAQILGQSGLLRLSDFSTATGRVICISDG